MQKSADNCTCQPGYVAAWPFVGGHSRTNFTVTEESKSVVSHSIVRLEPFVSSPRGDEQTSVVSTMFPSHSSVVHSHIQTNISFVWMDPSHTMRQTFNDTMNVTTVVQTVTMVNNTVSEGLVQSGMCVCMHV